MGSAARLRLRGAVIASAALAVASGVFVPPPVAVAATCTTTSTSCATDQELQVSVTSGSLAQSVDAAGANPSATTARLTGGVNDDGAALRMTGALNAVTVTDTRGGGFGWSLTGSVTDFVDGSHTISRDRLAATPHCDARAPGSAPGVSAGPPGQLAGSTVMLCTKDTSTGSSGSTGGSYEIGADLTLDVPTSQAPGDYVAVVTVLLA